MKLKRIIIAFVLLVICTCGFVVSYYFYNLTSVSEDTTDKIVVINQGTITSIGKTHKENNLIRNEFIFK